MCSLKAWKTHCRNVQWRLCFDALRHSILLLTACFFFAFSAMSPCIVVLSTHTSGGHELLCIPMITTSNELSGLSCGHEPTCFVLTTSCGHGPMYQVLLLFPVIRLCPLVSGCQNKSLLFSTSQTPNCHIHHISYIPHTATSPTSTHSLHTSPSYFSCRIRTLFANNVGLVD